MKPSVISDDSLLCRLSISINRLVRICKAPSFGLLTSKVHDELLYEMSRIYIKL